jgi:hypothetical protein
VYEWEANGTGSCKSVAQNGGCLYLVSTGKSRDASFFSDADENGDNVFIFTTSQLVRQDGDGLMDVYDARVEGGLASQNQVAEVPCESQESCPDPPKAPPSTGAPTSQNFSGPGSPPVKRCPKGKIRRRGKCVSKHPRHRKRHASKNRRAGK